MIKALAFLPPEAIPSAFQNLKCSKDLKKFHTYVEKTYIGTRNRPARYPPTLWSVNHLMLKRIPKTTNHAEGYHSKLIRMSDAKQLTLFKLICLLKDVVRDTSDIIMTIERGNKWPYPPRRSTVELNNRLLETVNRRKNGWFRTEEQFLEAIAGNMGLS